jgi:hypothetical protein
MGLHMEKVSRCSVNNKEGTELLGFWTFSIIWYSRERNVSETESVSVFR